MTEVLRLNKSDGQKSNRRSYHDYIKSCQFCDRLVYDEFGLA